MTVSLGSATARPSQQHQSLAASIPGGTATLIVGAGVVAAAALVGGGMLMVSKLTHGPSTPEAIEGVAVLANPKIALGDVLHGVRYTMPEQGVRLFGEAGGAKMSHLERAGATIVDGAAGGITGEGMGAAAARPSLWTRFLSRLGVGSDRLLNQVDQGALGDCWFDASMGSKTISDPAAIERMVADPVLDVAKVKDIATRHPEVAALVDASPDVKRKLSNYVLVETAQGANLVHRSLPFRAGTPAYAATNGEALWPGYLEKTAAAEVGGSYASLEGGWPREGWKLLWGTDAPEIARPASAVGYLRDEMAAGRAVAFTTRSSPNADDTLAKGLFGNHSYIPTKVTPAPANEMESFNPWGHKHPKPLTDDDLARLAHTVESEGGWFSLT